MSFLGFKLLRMLLLLIVLCCCVICFARVLHVAGIVFMRPLQVQVQVLWPVPLCLCVETQYESQPTQQ